MAPAKSTSHLGVREQPNAVDWLMIVAVLGAGIVFAFVVQSRTLRGFGDFEVFSHAAWAVWTGFPLYDVLDGHGWAYQYPPAFAILMGFFGSPMPGGAEAAWTLPYPVSVAIWYAISLASLLLAAHVAALAVERHGGIVMGGGRTGWWRLRVGAAASVLLVAGSSFVQGQPTTLIVLLCALFLKLYADGRIVGAAAAIALAASFKLYPAALLFIPLLRRDFRTLAAAGGWGAVFLLVLPAAVAGPEQTLSLYRTLWLDRLMDMAAGTVTEHINDEISPWTRDFVAFGAMLARTFDVPLPDRPFALPAWAWFAQVLFDIVILALVAALGHGRFWRWSGPQPDRPYATIVAGAVLSAALPAMLPPAQTHYWVGALPLIVVMIAEAWRRMGRAGWSPAFIAWAVLFSAAYLATSIPIWAPLQTHGPTTLVMLAGVGYGFWLLRRLPA